MAESNKQNRQSQNLTVDIYDQTYHLRGTDIDYLRRLAAMVDGKMRAVASNGNTVDSLRVAVLAALNMADELARLQERYRAIGGKNEREADLRDRADKLSGILDEVLDAQLAG
jgi:cell division protein ZapA